MKEKHISLQMVSEIGRKQAEMSMELLLDAFQRRAGAHCGDGDAELI